MLGGSQNNPIELEGVSAWYMTERRGTSHRQWKVVTIFIITHISYPKPKVFVLTILV